MVASSYSFIRNINWPDGEGSFKIHVITTDDGLKEAFRSTSEGLKIDGRKVEVGFTSYVLVPQDADVIFVTNRYNATIPTLLDRVSGKPVLFITDSYDKQRDIMINFLSKGSSSTFEFNRANIIYQGLRLKSSFEELNGREVDIAKIFKEARDSVRAMELRAKELDQRVQDMNLDLAASQGIFRKQTLRIGEVEEEIALKELEISFQDLILDSIKSKLNQSEERLITLESALDAREQELANLGSEIDEQRKAVTAGNKTLEDQNERIANQKKAIAEREEQLEEMSTVVDSQKNALIILIVFLLVVVGLTFLTFVAYRARKRAAKELAAQKEELQETQTQLVQSEKMASLGVLTAGIAHEINNAINFVYSGIHVLSDKVDEIRPVISHVTDIKEDDKNLKKAIQNLVQEREDTGYDAAQAIIDQMINSIKIGAERTTEIVKGLRVFSHSDDYNKVNIDIHGDIDVAILLLSSSNKENVTINKSLADHTPQVEGYSGQLSQAFLNIISNAIDAISETENKGVVDIQTFVDEGQVEIRIKDNGVGMTEEEKNKIFDPFFTTKKVGDGTGLGLSITYGIIERHGGTIIVNSSKNEGAEFVIKLPLIKEST